MDEKYQKLAKKSKLSLKQEFALMYLVCYSNIFFSNFLLHLFFIIFRNSLRNYEKANSINWHYFWADYFCIKMFKKKH